MFDFFKRRKIRRGDLPVLLITGMKREAACAAGDGVITLCSGASATQLRQSLERLKGQDFGAVISFGLAGGLDPALRPGDAIVAREIIAQGARYAVHPRLAAAMIDAVAKTGRAPVSDALVGVDQMAMDVAAKTALRKQTGAAALDMESHIAAAFAKANRTPFAAVRVVADPATRALPPLAAKAITPDGYIDNGYVTRELIRAPGQIGELIRTGLDSRAAFSTLGRVGPALGPLLRLMLADL
jgi:hopanoid-associated phosphorylase